MPRIEADNDDEGQTRSQLVIDELKRQIEHLETEHAKGKQLRNVVLVVDAVDATGEPDFAVLSAEDSLLTTVVGMLSIAQVVSAQQGIRICDTEEVILKPQTKPTNRLM